MARLTWDDTGKRLYETGVEKGVLYPIAGDGSYVNGVAWNGLTAVTESPSGAEATALYADDTKYLNLLSVEEFGGTVEAYAYPKEFGKALGSDIPIPGFSIGQQERKKFGMSYVTRIGNDIQKDDFGYKIHIIFGAKASPSDSEYATIDDSPDAITFSWDITTEPVNVSGYKPTASLVLDSRLFRESGSMNVLRGLEDILYGTEDTAAKLPFPDDIHELVEFHQVLRDSDGNEILDSESNTITTDVFI